MRDLCLTDESFTRLKSLILHENLRQIEKWGVQAHSPFEWLGYMTEQLGEVAKAVGEWEYRGGDGRDIIKETIHTATLALKIAEMFQDIVDNGDGR